MINRVLSPLLSTVRYNPVCVQLYDVQLYDVQLYYVRDRTVSTGRYALRCSRKDLGILVCAVAAVLALYTYGYI